MHIEMSPRGVLLLEQMEETIPQTGAQASLATEDTDFQFQESMITCSTTALSR